jgi:hypothetical protein
MSDEDKGVAEVKMLAWAKDRRENRLARWAEHRYRVPSGIFQDFLRKRPDVDETQVRLVGAGLVEWFLIEQKTPARPHVLPSLAVRSLIDCLSADTSYWRACVEKLSVNSSRAYVYPPLVCGQLRTTLHHAQQVENTAALPVLFNVDRACGIAGGHRYTMAVAPDVSHVCPAGTFCIHMQYAFSPELGPSGGALMP